MSDLWSMCVSVCICDVCVISMRVCACVCSMCVLTSTYHMCVCVHENVNVQTDDALEIFAVLP